MSIGVVGAEAGECQAEGRLSGDGAAPPSLWHGGFSATVALGDQLRVLPTCMQGTNERIIGNRAARTTHSASR
jgi:hypothetical protein